MGQPDEYIDTANNNSLSKTIKMATLLQHTVVDHTNVDGLRYISPVKVKDSSPASNTVVGRGVMEIPTGDSFHILMTNFANRKLFLQREMSVTEATEPSASIFNPVIINSL